MYLITRNKVVYLTAEGQVNVQSIVPADPTYEDVFPTLKEEIELKTNESYGPVGQWVWLQS